jgi:hypothetical protein
MHNTLADVTRENYNAFFFLMTPVQTAIAVRSTIPVCPPPLASPCADDSGISFFPSISPTSFSFWLFFPHDYDHFKILAIISKNCWKRESIPEGMLLRSPASKLVLGFELPAAADAHCFYCWVSCDVSCPCSC